MALRPQQERLHESHEAKQPPDANREAAAYSSTLSRRFTGMYTAVYCAMYTAVTLALTLMLPERIPVFTVSAPLAAVMTA